jgi:hypothetical protein
MRTFDLNTLNDGIDMGDGFRGTVTRSVRTANGVRLTVDIADVDNTNASKVDASKVQVGAVRTTGSVDGVPSNDDVAPALRDERDETSEEDSHRDADQNAGGATPDETPEDEEA